MAIKQPILGASTEIVKFLELVQSQVESFVTAVLQVFGSYSELFIAAMVLFFTFYAYNLFFTVGSGHGETVGTFLKKVISVLIFFILATNPAVYKKYIYNPVVKYTSGVASLSAKTISNKTGVSSLSNKTLGANGNYGAIGEFHSVAARSSAVLYKKCGVLSGGACGRWLLFEGSYIWFFSIIIYSITIALVNLGVLLALGPIFLILAVFKGISRSLFEGWVRAILQFVIVQFLVILVVSLIFFMITPTISPHSGKYVDKISNIENAGVIVIIFWVGSMIIKDIPKLAGSIVGGQSLGTTGGSPVGIVKAAAGEVGEAVAGAIKKGGKGISKSN